MARGRGGYRGSFRGHGGYYAVQYRPPAYRGGRGRGRGRARGRGMPTDRSFYQRSRDGTKLTLVRPSSSRVLCKYFLRGACTAGRGCLFSHDQRKLCPLFVAGRCRADANCRLGAQEVSEYNRPVCEGFLQGRCEKGDDCNLGHVYTGRVACPDFTEFGMCGEGSKCAKMHSMFCPRYGDAGGCPDPLCKMAHKSAPERMLAQKGLIEVPEEVEKAAGTSAHMLRFGLASGRVLTLHLFCVSFFFALFSHAVLAGSSFLCLFA